jgi:hypothetical protein
MIKTSKIRKIRIVSLLHTKERYENLRRLKKPNRKKQIERRKKIHQQMLFAQGLIVGDLNRRPIILPEVFSFWDNYQETADALLAIREHGLAKRVPLTIRFDRVKHLDPSATLALAAEIFRCRKLRVYRDGTFVTGNYPNDPIIHSQLSEMGFFRLLGISDVPINPISDDSLPHPVFLKFITDTRVDGAIVDMFVSIIEGRIVALNAVARGRLVGAIKEAMGNVSDHAYQKPTLFQSMKKRWYMSSRVNIDKHEVMIMLYDQGSGIPNTLDADLIDRITAALSGNVDKTLHATDGYIIKLATEIWRTGTGQSGRGRGFRDMKRFIDLCPEGELRVLSNRGRYTYVGGRENFDDLSPSSGGTMIEWRFQSEVLLEMTDD